jgi:hypothetical protein
MTTRTETPTVLDLLEAEARKTMAGIAGMQVRGFDTAKAKADEIARLDILFDQHNEIAKAQQ